MLSVRAENSEGLLAPSKKIPKDENTHIKGAAIRTATWRVILDLSVFEAIDMKCLRLKAEKETKIHLSEFDYAI